MTPINIEYHESYASMSEEAQKTGAFPVHKKTVSRRLVIKTKPTESNEEGLNKRYSKMKEIASEIFKNVLEKGVGCEYAKDEKNHSFIQFYLIRSSQETFHNKEKRPVGRITVSVHNDHITITTVLSLENCNHHDPIINCPVLKPEEEKTPPILDILIKGFNDFKQGRNEALTFIQSNYDIDSKDIRENQFINSSGKLLYYDLWEKVDEHIFKDVIPKNKDLQIIADIRGAIFPRSKELSSFYRLEPFPRSDDHTNTNDVQKQKLYPFSNNEYAKATLNCLFPLFTPLSNFKYREFVGCTMFDKRTIFVSPISTIKLHKNHRNLNEEQMEQTPICFALSPHYNDVWQSGRMLHRVNMIASFRALSICDIERFRSASRHLKEINYNLHKARKDHFKEIVDKASRHDEKVNQPNINKYLYEINKIERDLSIFNIKIGVSDTVEMPLHAVEYDLYRAELVSTRFRTQIKDLRIGRIEGWQPYDEYVRRRIYPIQEYIKRISIRLVELQTLIDGSLRSSLAEIQKENSIEIVRINKSFAKAHKFQLIVETMAISYYGGYVFYSITYLFGYLLPKTLIDLILPIIYVDEFYIKALATEKALYFFMSLTSIFALLRYKKPHAITAQGSITQSQ